MIYAWWLLSLILPFICYADVPVKRIAGSTLGRANGYGTNSQFYNSGHISISRDQKFALIGDLNNNQVRKLVLSTKQVTILAGDPNGVRGLVNDVGTSSQILVLFQEHMNR